MRQAEQISNTFLGAQIKFSILFAAAAATSATFANIEANPPIAHATSVHSATFAVVAVVNVRVCLVDMNTEFLLKLEDIHLD